MRSVRIDAPDSTDPSTEVPVNSKDRINSNHQIKSTKLIPGESIVSSGRHPARGRLLLQSNQSLIQKGQESVVPKSQQSRIQRRGESISEEIGSNQDYSDPDLQEFDQIHNQIMTTQPSHTIPPQLKTSQKLAVVGSKTGNVIKSTALLQSFVSRTPGEIM